MHLTASWTGDLGVQFQLFLLFFVVLGHFFQEGGKRWTAVLTEVVNILVGHSCPLIVSAESGFQCYNKSDGKELFDCSVQSRVLPITIKEWKSA